jgi:hypothetical protein
VREGARVDISVCSAVPGRIRLRIKDVKGNPKLATELQDRLRSLEGVQRAEANLRAGSITINYDHQRVSADALTGVLSGVEPEPVRRRLAVPARQIVPSAAVAGSVSAFFRRLNAQSRRMTGGLDFRILVPLILLSLGIRDLILTRRITTPPWYTLFWYAFGTYGRLVKSDAEETAE